ncbi:K(+)/H(+) antiporter 1 [Wickerhamomyces ciferrii]|uniref:K(+)/H(+) antiporter 1 n=1 Tax=Wickerhamomyces ciferrii (strain ATCC 14091 / BCRC 22168 / CBS 111 / JCM 3599 / NBRC 0793 / NRRL Y-1031 F-60-10) TaxID=1206466 RepID=K0KXX2_WICCF|nr:K(+)/H(+) antiporter 1 [Wickerhamomyces ciferrii]CCH46917.1 K(+)/H(+) antiporter 1 [Wickerhamomyces ciferrii]
MAVDTSSVAGIIAGRDPLKFTSGNPLTLFLFQAIFIIALCQIIHLPLGYMKQPRVIAEVISGILLGPSVFGRIPDFTSTCFPKESIPLLTLVANIGVVLFLFLVGLEVDVQFIKKNIKIALSVGLVNMAIPFGLGCAVSVGIYNQYKVVQDGEPTIKFTTYMVFIAVAMCITAFPVLARILTELRLLKERVGTIVLAAGITNDVVGWMLLALSVTLANAGSGITTLYILLVVIGWALFVIFPMRWFLRKVIMRKDLKKGSLSRFSIMIILIFVFISSFFTDIIGAHPIFGAFLVGVIVPREYGFVIDLTNKIEDLVHIVLIPIYFALAGFNVNFAELNQGIDWAYIIGIIVIAMVGKIFGGYVSAKFNGLLWRESLAVGVLMSCKGIVEIVVLNVGLTADIISHKVFSMFVVMTLVSTFLTTPLTLLVYPVWYREKVEKYLRGEIDWEGKPLDYIQKNGDIKDDLSNINDAKLNNLDYNLRKLVYNVEDVDGFLPLLNFLELFYGHSSNTVNSENKITPFHAIYLQELTERTTDLIGASSNKEMTYNPQLELLNKIFEFNEIPFISDLRYFVKEDKFELLTEISDTMDDLLIYAVNEFDSTMISNIDLSLLYSQFAILIKNNESKITHVDVVLDSSKPQNDSLVFYLLRQFAFNIHSITVYMKGDQDLYETRLNELKIAHNSEEYLEETKLHGLVITGLDPETLQLDITQSKEENYDLLLVKQLK